MRSMLIAPMRGGGWFIAALFLLPAPKSSWAQSQPSTPDGFALLESGKAEEARTVFEAILGSRPDDQQAQEGEVKASEAVALRERGVGHMVEALTALMRAQDYAPRNPHLLLDLGVLEDEMQLYPEAEKSLAAALQIEPDKPETYYALARVKMDEGQLDAAEQNMKVFLKAHPEDAGAHYGLGRIYQLGMQFDEARGEFERSIQLQPVQTEAYYELGDVALKQDNYSEALSCFQKVLMRDSRHGGALADAGQALFREKHYEEAVDYLRRAIAVAPNYQPGHYYLGLTLSRLGQKEESDRELLEAQKLADEENKNAGRHYQISRTPLPQ
jgi:tetratricopeptide (TPR) repeat protein